MIGKLNHVAIAVPDLDAAAAQYRDTLGARVNPPQDEPDHGVTVVFIDLPNTKIELLHPLGDDSPINGFLAKNPSGGIHHICYEVDDILAARDRLDRLGRTGAGIGRAEDRSTWQAGPVPASEGFHRNACRTGAGLMGIFSAFVLFAMIWAMVFLIGLQVGQDTQGDRGERVPGTHVSSPAEFNLWRRVGIATAITLVLWVPLVWFIMSGTLSIDDLRRWTGRPEFGG